MSLTSVALVKPVAAVVLAAVLDLAALGAADPARLESADTDGLLAFGFARLNLAAPLLIAGRALTFGSVVSTLVSDATRAGGLKAFLVA